MTEKDLVLAECLQVRIVPFGPLGAANQYVILFALKDFHGEVCCEWGANHGECWNKAAIIARWAQQQRAG